MSYDDTNYGGLWDSRVQRQASRNYPFQGFGADEAPAPAGDTKKKPNIEDAQAGFNLGNSILNAGLQTASTIATISAKTPPPRSKKQAKKKVKVKRARASVTSAEAKKQGSWQAGPAATQVAPSPPADPHAPAQAGISPGVIVAGVLGAVGLGWLISRK